MLDFYILEFWDLGMIWNLEFLDLGVFGFWNLFLGICEDFVFFPLGLWILGFGFLIWYFWSLLLLQLLERQPCRKVGYACRKVSASHNNSNNFFLILSMLHFFSWTLDSWFWILDLEFKRERKKINCQKNSASALPAKPSFSFFLGLRAWGELSRIFSAHFWSLFQIFKKKTFMSPTLQLFFVISILLVSL